MNDVENKTLIDLIDALPPLKDFLVYMGLPLEGLDAAVDTYIAALDDLSLEEVGLTRLELRGLMFSYMEYLQQLCRQQARIDSLTILGGTDKQGNIEQVEFHAKAGEIVCLVGPTGSGKSRLLEDIEWMAQGDTPTRRRILIDGRNPQGESMFSCSQRMVAQLSQNMNFVMDITVQDFIKTHAESRMLDNTEELVEQVVSQANSLSGESIDRTTPVTSLSGGQSRALMIADIACLSSSPIVLIDEIENAGINRKTALELLVQSKKIVIIATHDPILALMGHRRLVMKNGGITKVVERTEAERSLLNQLQVWDEKINVLRHYLREGNILNDIKTWF